jgi:hypothetical protein
VLLLERVPRITGLRPAVAVGALVVVLAASWIADFRYAGFRSGKSWNWAPIAARWRHDCDRSRTGEIVVRTGVVVQTLRCDRLR